MSRHLGTDSPPHAGRPALQTPLLRLLGGQGQGAGRVKPGRRSSGHRLCPRGWPGTAAGRARGPGLGSFAAPAVSGALFSCAPRHVWSPAVSFWMWCLIFYPVSCLRFSSLGLVPSAPLEMLLTPTGVGSWWEVGVRRRRRLQSERLSSPGEAPVCLFPHPGLQGPLACGRTPQPLPLSSQGRPPPGLSCCTRRRVGFTAHLDRPAWSHLKTTFGVGGSLRWETPPSDSIPSWLRRVCAFRERCSSHQSLLLFSCKHPGDRRWRGQPARRLTPKLATWPGGLQKVHGKARSRTRLRSALQERSGFAHE